MMRYQGILGMICFLFFSGMANDLFDLKPDKVILKENITTLELEKAVDIKILSKEEAAKIAINTQNDPFIENIEVHEYALLGPRSFKFSHKKVEAQQQFKKLMAEGMVTISPQASFLLEKMIREIVVEMYPVFPDLVSIPWRLAVFQSDLCGGMPHTRGETIFIPQTLITMLMAEEQKRKMTLEKSYLYFDSKSTLLHEQVHVWQRNNLNQAVMKNLYQQWGLLKAILPELSDSVKSQKLSNPDTPDLGWIWQEVKADGQLAWWLPMLMLNHGRLRYQLIPIDYQEKTGVITWKNQSPQNIQTNFLYLRSFPFVYVLPSLPYHPHEAVAYYTEFYYKACIENKKLNKQQKDLLNTLQKYFRKSSDK